jgi:hypothetical protein
MTLKEKILIALLILGVLAIIFFAPDDDSKSKSSSVSLPSFP